MLVSRIIGGLGNQMFEYAAARAASLRISVQLKLDLSGFETYDLHAYGLNNFNIVEDVAKKDDYFIGAPESLLKKIKKYLRGLIQLESFRESDLSFDSKVLELNDNTYLDGYWQCERYFIDFDKQIRQDFSFKFAPDALNQRYLELIDSVNAVSVHIRRGDYVSNSTTNEIHGVCDLDYYQRAAEFMRARIGPENLHFFVFSDDTDWVKENISFGSDTTFISHNDAAKNYEDMRLMSACKHHIIANSSFSWWAAWLNPSKQKVVIAPRQWFKSTLLNSDDIVPASWVRL
ncbi:alpha-1,2-fucosyltransferase [Methylotenera mobilis]|uniref:Glycosyl transferase family 11 n=1 Tax=Methylotenera mobilis (strain JLW8 / ATCC BAA-1282 / DSM 17540) TaxID=583345 RepID=C6WVJ1_METML|nr:alpha-1,2-fucosyltransferase [Methylotenera mobilis]ACT47940.1 glycosyl transferase family 11 [Methylotenera mobilis JLW8]